MSSYNKDISQEITKLAIDMLPKAKLNSCYFNMKPRKYSNGKTAAVWLFPDGIFRLPNIDKTKIDHKYANMEHWNVKQLFKKLHNHDNIPLNESEIMRDFAKYTKAIRIRCSETPKNKEFLVELNIPKDYNRQITNKQKQSIQKEMCDFQYNKLSYSFLKYTSNQFFWSDNSIVKPITHCKTDFKILMNNYDESIQLEKKWHKSFTIEQSIKKEYNTLLNSYNNKNINKCENDIIGKDKFEYPLNHNLNWGISERIRYFTNNKIENGNTFNLFKKCLIKNSI